MLFKTKSVSDSTPFFFRENEMTCFSAGIECALQILQNVTSREDMERTASMIEMMSKCCNETIDTLQQSWPHQTWHQVNVVVRL